MRSTIAAFGLAVVLAGPVIAAPCAGFEDVPADSAFCPNVEWVKNRGVTLGCAVGLYCPNDSVSRLAMAAFLSRLDPMLAPTFYASNGAVFGYYVLGAPMHPSLRAIPYAVLARSGTRYYVPLGTMPHADGGIRFDAAAAVPYYELPNCDPSGRIWMQFNADGLGTPEPFSRQWAAFGGEFASHRLFGAMAKANVPVSPASRHPSNGSCEATTEVLEVGHTYEMVDIGEAPPPPLTLR